MAADDVPVTASDTSHLSDTPSSSRVVEPAQAVPRPARVDLARVVRVGTLVWLVALVGTVAAVVVQGPQAWPAVRVAVAGVLLGLAGIAWTRRHRARWDA